MIAVTNLYHCVEEAYESANGVSKSELDGWYKQFKEVVPTKAQEKQLDKSFQKASGYSIYRTMQASQKATSKRVKMSEG